METPTWGALYRAAYQLDGDVRYIIWREGIESSWDDGVHIDEETGKSPAFATLDELDAYAMEHGLTLEQQDSGIKPIDLDAVAYWIRNPDAESVNCIAFLEAWNL